MNRPPAPPDKQLVKMPLRTTLSLAELSDIFELSPLIIKGRISTTEHKGTGKNGVYLWELGDICEIVDKRVERDSINELISKTKRNNKRKSSGEDVDPKDLTPANFKLHYQGLEAREMYLAKRYKNEIATGELMESNNVEEVVISAFKTVVDFLSNFPDRLERDGLIQGDKIVELVKYIDDVRDQLATDLEVVINE